MKRPVMRNVDEEKGGKVGRREQDGRVGKTEGTGMRRIEGEWGRSKQM